MNSYSVTGDKQKRTILATALAVALGSGAVDAGQVTIGTGVLPIIDLSSNFTMLQSTGAIQGGTNDVQMSWDGTVFTSSTDYTGPGSLSNMTLVSTTPFSSNLWAAHDIQVFGPGTYTFDATLGSGVMGVNDNESGTVSMTVGANQLGAHMLFDWGGNHNIDVVLVWDQSNVFGSGVGATTTGLMTCGLLGGGAGTNCLWDGPNAGPAGAPPGNQVWQLVSTDDDGDGTPGVPMPTGGPFAGFNASFNIRGISNFSPLVMNDSGAGFNTTPGGTVTNLNVLANDLDIDGTLDVTTVLVSNPVGGTATVNPDGTIDWTNTSITPGTDTFNYTVTDNSGNVSQQATVSIVVAAGALPVANNDTVVATEDTPLVIDIATALLANDTPMGSVNFDPSSLTQPAPGQGSVAITGGGTTLTYTPPQDFDTGTSFTYNVLDASLQSALSPATVTINITPVDDPPLAVDDSAVTQTDQAVTINVTSNDSDVDDPISVTNVGLASNGTVVNNNDGSVTYTPASGFSGVDSFTYEITGGALTDTATVTVTVIGTQFEGIIGPPLLPGPEETGSSNFTMLTNNGSLQGGTNDVVVTWDGSLKSAENDTVSNMNVSSAGPTKFSGFVWVAHDVRVFGPGSYTFEACPETSPGSGVVADDSTRCTPGATPLNLNVGPNQLGIHMLFDWGQDTTSTQCGKSNCSIDVAQVMEINGAFVGALDGADSFDADGATFNLVSIDGDGDGISGVPMPDGAFVGFNSNFSFNFMQRFSLPAASLSVMQGGNPVAAIVPSAGIVTVTATPSTGSLAYDWDSALLNQQTDQALVAANTNGTTSQTFQFDPSGLADGAYMARVTVTSTDPSLQGKSGGLSNYAILPLRVDAALTPAQAMDSDGDGIPDGQDSGTLAVNQLQTVARNSASFIMQSSAGTLRLGDTAKQAGASSGAYAAGIAFSDIGIADPESIDSCVGGCFDFKVTGLTAGDSVDVVVPLSTALLDGAKYRKFYNGQWHAYSLIQGNAIASAPGGAGTCPPPGDPAYRAGLNTGDFCVQLTIVDGGRNDADGLLDGNISDPGGVVQPAVDQGPLVSNVSSPQGLGGGCVLSASRLDQQRHRGDWWLIVGMLAVLALARRRIRTPGLGRD